MQNRYATQRRETAARELGQTHARRSVLFVLLVAFWATMLSVPAIQFIAEARRVDEMKARSETDSEPATVDRPDVGRSPRRWATIRSVGDLWRLIPGPKAIRKQEDALEDNSVVGRWLLPRVQFILTGVFGAGNEQAYPGRDGWLYYRPDVDYLTGRGFLDPGRLAARALEGDAWEEPPQPDPVRAILDFKRQLDARGIRLVLMPTPVKPVVLPEPLAGGEFHHDGPVQNPSYPQFLAAMKDAGILVFDVSAALRERAQTTGMSQYLKTDSHWTPEAMNLAARELATRLQAEIDLPRRANTSYVARPVEIENLGDIAAMLKLPEGHRIFPPERVTVEEVVSADGERWAPHPDAPILLLGDSFSNIYSLEGMGWGTSGGFAEQLSRALQSPVDRIVLNAGGAYATRQQLARDLARGRDRLAGKRVVVYQFAMRELASGDWRLYDLSVAEPATRSTPLVATSEVLIRGVVREKTNPPEPGSTPYPDSVIALHLADIRAVEGDIPTDEAVVFLWGMRNNRWTPAASLRVGESVMLRVRPWDDVQAEYGSVNRQELDSEAAWLLDVYWGEMVE